MQHMETYLSGVHSERISLAIIGWKSLSVGYLSTIRTSRPLIRFRRSVTNKVGNRQKMSQPSVRRRERGHHVEQLEFKVV